MGNCIKTSISKNEASNQIDKSHGEFLDQSHQYPIYIPPIKSGRVIKVYDGDTITIVSRIPNSRDKSMYKFSIRLNGIDTPEIKTKNEDEKKIAKLAKSTLYHKIYNKQVILKNVQLEKYGRLLCEVFLNDLHLNQWLLDQRLAVPYDGGTKNIPESWEKYYNNSV